MPVAAVAVPAFSDGSLTAAVPAVAPVDDPDYFSIGRKDGRIRLLGVDLPPGSTIATRPDMPDHIAAWMDISPKTAREWHERYNKVNRGVKKASREAWTDDIRRGDWIIDGNTIRFTPWGDDIEELDGQHRLLAIANGTKTVTSLVVFGITPAARAVIDSGNSRSFADVLKMKGYANGTLIQALTKRYPSYLLGDRVDLARIKVSNTWLLAEFYKHEDRLLEAVAFARRMGQASRRRPVAGTMPTLTGSVWGLAYLVFSDIAGKDTALKYLEDQFLHGENLSRGDPAMAARNRIMTADKTNEQLDETKRCLVVWRGWNGYRGHLRFDKIQLPDGGRRQIVPEEFPEAA